ncbi:MAG: hypothetical protein U0V49_13135 [Saprospiraceae bacterium]
MKHSLFLKLFALATILASHSGCCRYADCIDYEYPIYLSVQDSVKGHDLVFGNHRKFTSRDLVFYSVKGADSSYYTFKFTEFKSNKTDSAIRIIIYPDQPEIIFVQIKGNVSDTLRLQYRKYDSKCCGSGTAIDKIIAGRNEYDWSHFPVVLFQ